MNWPFAAAGAVALVGAAIHGIVGDRLMLRIAPDALPASALGDPEFSRMLVRVSWHFVTVTFVASGLALLYAGFNVTAPVVPGLAVFLGVLYTCFALFAVVVGITRQTFFKHPAPIALSAVAILIWWGVSRLRPKAVINPFSAPC